MSAVKTCVDDDQGPVKVQYAIILDNTDNIKLIHSGEMVQDHSKKRGPTTSLRSGLRHEWNVTTQKDVSVLPVEETDPNNVEMVNTMDVDATVVGVQAVSKTNY